MINLINTYVEMQKKLDKEYDIISVSVRYGMPTAQVSTIGGLDSFLEIGENSEIYVEERFSDEYPYEATFVRHNIKFIAVLDKKEYEEIIKIEGVKHE